MRIYADSGNDIKQIITDICIQYNFTLKKFQAGDVYNKDYYFVKCMSNYGFGVSVTIDTDYNQVDIIVKADVRFKQDADTLIEQIEEAKALASDIADVFGVRW